jgi:15-cis-phytoene synthase
VARTFSLATRLLPREVRDDVHLLYLVFRTLDDLVDDGRPEAEARVAAVEAWARGEAVAATPEVDILRALEGRHPLPRASFTAFCAGMRQDLDREPFLTDADLERYCYRVAGTVGEVMASVLGVHDQARGMAAAATLGMAMQRTNILRDLDEDDAAGRSYVPADAVLRFGPALPGRREAFLREQIARADALYDEGMAGIAQLRRGRVAIAAAAVMYREILRQIERDGLGARAGRSHVSLPRKLRVVVPAAVRAR